MGRTDKRKVQAMAYEGFQRYDVLQVRRASGFQFGEWLDYSTIRTEDDAAHAERYVKGNHPNANKGETFRIVGFTDDGEWGVKVAPVEF